MLGELELKLVQAQELRGFPLMRLVSDAAQRCKVCKHSGIDLRSMLRLALERNCRDKKFIQAVAKIIPLPAVVCGMVIKEQ